MQNSLLRVLVAGIGGASLGTELIKSLTAAKRYEVFGCDISSLAYGHYDQGCSKSFVIPKSSYVESVLKICQENEIRAVVPGGEGPLELLGPAARELQSFGICVAANSPEVISLCSDKALLFDRLRSLSQPMPWTATIEHIDSADQFPMPCVIKPALGTGGSRFVFLAADQREAELYLTYVLENCKKALIQEYIPENEGEFTIGVLSSPSDRLIGSVALRRTFNAKLSVLTQTKTGLISTGYSQGFIEDFASVRSQAEKIADLLGSTGPLNIQGRMRDGILIPFEINPRFSASTYLRAMAGFNEVDLFLRSVLLEEKTLNFTIRPGYYLRSLSELYVPVEDIIR